MQPLDDVFCRLKNHQCAQGISTKPVNMGFDIKKWQPTEV